MATRRIAAVLLLTLLNACAAQRVVRLDTGQEVPIEYRPPTSNKSVRVDAEAFEEALTQLVLNAPLTLRPPQQGWLVRASYPSNAPDTRWQRLMSKSFGGICEPGQRKETCLSLLDDVMGLSKWDKLGVGLALSIDPLRESISLAVNDRGLGMAGLKAGDAAQLHGGGGTGGLTTAPHTFGDRTGERGGSFRRWHHHHCPGAHCGRHDSREDKLRWGDIRGSIGNRWGWRTTCRLHEKLPGDATRRIT